MTSRTLVDNTRSTFSPYRELAWGEQYQNQHVADPSLPLDFLYALQYGSTQPGVKLLLHPGHGQARTRSRSVNPQQHSPVRSQVQRNFIDGLDFIQDKVDLSVIFDSRVKQGDSPR